MSMVRMFAMRCDLYGTGGDDHYGWYSSDVRVQAKKNGWRIGNKDYCPNCQDKNQECDEIAD